jgi:LacI family transcriptional regulator
MPKRGTLKTTRIGLLLSEKTEYGRGVLRGIADFAKDNPHLRFRVEDPDRAGLAAMEAWPADGLIVMLNDKSLTPRLLALGRPTVTVCNLPGVPESLCVQSHDRMVGRLGAEHLLELRAATYGFVGLTEGAYVAVRAAAFAETINQTGRNCAVFHPLGRKAGVAECRALEQWLRRCPKPLAMMASNDSCGRLVMETCRNAGMQIPNDVAVLGVDNEDPLSRLVWPGLSSISLATEQIGLRAADLMHRLLEGLARPRSSTLLAPLGVVARGSTRPLVPDDPVVAKAIAAIHESVGRRLSVGDLLQQLPGSRISLERRFRRLLDRTPAQEIRRVRIAQARQLLMATDLPLKSIAERCGFAAASRLIEAFRRETGSTPGVYRARTARQRK